MGDFIFQQLSLRAGSKADSASLYPVLLINLWTLTSQWPFARLVCACSCNITRMKCHVYVLPIRGRLICCCSEGGEDDFSSVTLRLESNPSTVQNNTHRIYGIN